LSAERWCRLVAFLSYALRLNHNVLNLDVTENHRPLVLFDRAVSLFLLPKKNLNASWVDILIDFAVDFLLHYFYVSLRAVFVLTKADSGVP
jgi:hypothetical protein